jgi:hypothetical protein
LALGWHSLTYFTIGRGIRTTTQKEDHLILKAYNQDSTDVLMVQKSKDWKKGCDTFDTNRVKTIGPFRRIQTIGYYEIPMLEY